MEWLRRNKYLVVILPVVGVIALIAALSRPAVIPVRAETAERENISNTITTNGKVEPDDNFQARAVAPGIVNKLYVREGDKVRAGQQLVRLNDADARAQAARALAQLRAAEADLAAVGKGGSQEEVLTNQAELVKARAERDTAARNLAAVKRLRENGTASEGELQEAQNRLQSAEAGLKLLEQRRTERFSNPEIAKVQARADEARAEFAAAQNVLRNANIVAPRAGTVYALPLREGGFVNPGDLIVQVADLSRMQVRAFVDEPDIGKLARGQKVTIAWDAVPGRTWEGEVARVPSAVIPRGTRNVGEVVVAVDNRDLKLLPNINVNVRIVTAQQPNAVTVSRESVMQDSNKRYVYRIEQGKLTRTEVETGISNLTRIEVRSGLNEGVQVAKGSLSSQPLRDGASVKIIQ